MSAGAFRIHNLSFACVCAVGLVFSGCGPREHAHSHSETESNELALFEKGRGVRLPEEMRRSLALETIEVVDRPMEQPIRLNAQVYRAASGSIPAAAVVWMDPIDSSRITPGQPVMLHGYESAETFPGRWLKTGGVTNAWGQSEGLLEFADPGRRFASGSTLKATLGAGQTNSATAVPATAVIQGVEGPFVYTVNGSHFIRTPVKARGEGSDWLEISDGLYAGDVVVAKGAETLWMIELCALKGGSPCCPVGKKAGHFGH